MQLYTSLYFGPLVFCGCITLHQWKRQWLKLKSGILLLTEIVFKVWSPRNEFDVSRIKTYLIVSCKRSFALFTSTRCLICWPRHYGLALIASQKCLLNHLIPILISVANSSTGSMQVTCPRYLNSTFVSLHWPVKANIQRENIYDLYKTRVDCYSQHLYTWQRWLSSSTLESSPFLPTANPYSSKEGSTGPLFGLQLPTSIFRIETTPSSYTAPSHLANTTPLTY